MRPGSPVDDVVNGPTTDAIELSQLLLLDSSGKQLADRPNAAVAKFCKRVPRSSVRCSMALFVSMVLLGGRPTEVWIGVKRLVSVSVSDVMLFGGRRPQESNCNQSVHKPSVFLAVVAEGNLVIPILRQNRV